MANACNELVICGLGTFTASVPAAGSYSIEGKLTLPRITGGNTANSQVVCVVKQNSSTIYTSSPGDAGFKIGVICAATDTISVTTSSSLSADQGIRAVKGVVAIG